MFSSLVARIPPPGLFGVGIQLLTVAYKINLPGKPFPPQHAFIHSASAW